MSKDTERALAWGAAAIFVIFAFQVIPTAPARVNPMAADLEDAAGKFWEELGKVHDEFEDARNANPAHRPSYYFICEEKFHLAVLDSLYRIAWNERIDVTNDIILSELELHRSRMAEFGIANREDVDPARELCLDHDRDRVKAWKRTLAKLNVSWLPQKSPPG